MADERGSTKWIHERFQKGIPEELVDRLFEVSQEDGIALWDVWIKGQPPRVDELMASYQVQRGLIGSVVDRVLSLHPEIPLHVIIKGQPPRLEATEVVFRTQGF